jgi:hypothetical protein
MLVAKSEVRRQLGRTRRNIKTDLVEIGWEGVDWINLAQVRYRLRDLVNAVMNLWIT